MDINFYFLDYLAKRRDNMIKDLKENSISEEYYIK